MLSKLLFVAIASLAISNLLYLFPQKVECQSSNFSTLIFLKNLNSKFHCFSKVKEFFSQSVAGNLTTDLLKKNQNTGLFKTYNYSSSQEFLLEFIIGQTFYLSNFYQGGQLLIAAAVDEESTTLISDIILPYNNFLFFDFNNYNYKISYRNNAAPLYAPLDIIFKSIIESVRFKRLIVLVMTEDNKETVFDSFEYAKKYTNLNVIEYTVNYKNVELMSKIVEELAFYSNNSFIIFNGDFYSSLNTFLSACQFHGLQLETILINSDYILIEDMKEMIKFKDTVKSFLVDTRVTGNLRKVICSGFTDNRWNSYMDSDTFNFYKIDFTRTDISSFIFVYWTDKNETHFQSLNYTALTGLFSSSKYTVTCMPGFEQILRLFQSNGKKEKWSYCVPCNDQSFKESYGNLKCQECPLNFISNSNKTGCKDPFTSEHIVFDNIEGIFITFFSGLSSFFSVFITLTLFHQRKTPVVRTTYFTFSVMEGICHLFISILVPILYLTKITLIICTVRHIILGFFLTLCSAVIYIKTKKYVRVFKIAYRLTQKEKLIATSFDIMAMSFILVVQILLGSIILIRSPPNIIYHLNYEKKIRVLQCSSDSQFSFQILYIGCMLLICSFQSFHTRNLPSYFNETFSITYSTGISCILLICYFPIYYGNQNIKKRTNAVAILILAINFTLMTIMFSPKLYLIYLRSDKNSKRCIQTKITDYSKSLSTM